MGIYQIRTEVVVRASIKEVWDFISSPSNLKKITPDYMGFDIKSLDLPQKMYEGMIIEYIVSPLLGIKMTWVTEITHLKEGHYFVDEQRIGPYKLWHHQHLISQTVNGTLINDIVTYKPPLGIAGNLANTLVIREKLREIFEYRRVALLKELGSTDKELDPS